MHENVRAFLEYLESERNYSPNTLRSYEADLLQLVSYLQSNNIRSLNLVQKNTLRAYLSSLLAAGLSRRSVGRKIACLRSFFRFTKRRRITTSNPTLTLISPKIEKRLPSFLDERTMSRLFDKLDAKTPEGRRDSAILELFYSTGIRLGELIGLNLDDVDLEQGIVKVTGKGRKQRIVPLGRKAIAALKQYHADRSRLARRSAEGSSQPALFLTAKGERFYPEAITRIVKGHIGKVSELEKTSPHVIRHTFATHLLDRGADLRAVKELLGHESLSTTQVYTHVSTERMKKVYRQSHPKA
ncbi:MAG: tyrosine recombinase XerC [Bacteroidota bacterium]